MLYLRVIDDAAFTHATKSVTNPVALCGTAVGRTRLDREEQRLFDPQTSTTTLLRLPVPVSRPDEVTCDKCAAFLKPRRIRARKA